MERHIIPLHDIDGRTIWYDSTDRIEALTERIIRVSRGGLFDAATQKHRGALLNKALLNEARYSVLLDQGGQCRSSLGCVSLAEDICGRDLDEEAVLKLYRLISRNELSRSITGLHKVDGVIEFIDFYNYYECAPLVKSSLICYFFDKVHPLHDSSGRMGRLLALMLLLRNGYEFARYCPLSQLAFQNRSELQRALGCSGKDGATRFIEAMLNSYAEGVDALAKSGSNEHKTIS